MRFSVPWSAWLRGSRGTVLLQRARGVSIHAAGVELVVRADTVLAYAAIGYALDLLILPWALVVHRARSRQHLSLPIDMWTAVSPSAPTIHLAALALVLLLAVAALLHEAGHAAALWLYGAADVRVTLHPGGGRCTAQATNTSPRATLLYATAGPAATLLVVAALFAARTALPLLHAAKVVLWLAAAIQAVSLAANVVPVHPKCDGAHMLRAVLLLSYRRDPGEFAVLYLWRPFVVAWIMLGLAAFGFVTHPNHGYVQAALLTFGCAVALGLIPLVSLVRAWMLPSVRRELATVPRPGTPGVLL